MSITVNQVSKFVRGPWDSRADAFRYTAEQSADQALTLRHTGESVKDAWRDTIGDMIAERCE